MRLNKIALGLGVALATITAASSVANAAKFTFDYRHDYRTGYRQHFDRIAIITAFDNGIGFYVDSSFKSGSAAPGSAEYDEGEWGDFVSNATEMSIWYNYKIDGTGFSLSPGLVTESTSGSTAYKPYLRVQYNTNMGLWFALRGRLDYARNDGPAPDTRNARLDTWIGYNSGNFGINYNFSYIKALTDNPDGSTRYLYNKNDYNMEHNVAVSYSMGQWKPYFEIGNIADVGTAEKSGRQMRLRAGVQYTF